MTSGPTNPAPSRSRTGRCATRAVCSSRTTRGSATRKSDSTTRSVVSGAAFDGYVHYKCKPKAEVLEGGKPHTVTVRMFSTAPNVCRDCNTEHAGPCW